MNMGYFKFSSNLLNNRDFYTHLITDEGNLHTHDFYEFSYVVRGRVMHKTSETDCSYLTNNTMVIIKPNTAHAFNEDKESDCYHRDIIISKQFFKKICSQIHPNTYSIFSQLPPITNLPLPKQTLNFLEHSLSYFNTAQKIDSVIANSIKFLTTSTIINLILSNTNYSNTSVYSEIYENLLLKMSLPSVLEGGISVLTKEMNYSQVHLNRIAKEFDGRTIFAILTKYRMQHAAKLLKTTDLAIDNIAYLVGYNSVSHFSEAFKKEFGLSPSKYRISELFTPSKGGMFGPNEVE